MITTALSRPDWFSPDLAIPNLARRWRDLASRCQPSFFQDWTWVGCLAAERYPDPVLAEAFQDGQTVGLALFGRRRDRPWGETLSLNETGMPRWDAVFIEHNGPLVVADGVDGRVVTTRLLQAASAGATRCLALSGVDGAIADIAAELGGAVYHQATRTAPYVDFGTLGPLAFIDTLSRNTRHQLRRSNRAYAERGPLDACRAETVATGLQYFAEMVRLHDITWRARGLEGAFASPEVQRFHRALIDEGLPRGEVDLIRIAAGGDALGYLMNFSHRGAVSAYQSGFDYGSAGPHMKPGLTSHYLAIETARAAGARTYDFLAGPSRYKSSFANAEQDLHWLRVAPVAHPFAWREGVKRLLHKHRSASPPAIKQLLTDPGYSAEEGHGRG